MRRLGRMAAAAVSAALMLTTAACDDSGNQPSELSDSTSTSTSAPTSESESTASSPSTDPEEQAVITAYKGFFETLVQLGAAKDDTEVREMVAPYAAGPAVERLVTLMATLRSNNQEPGGTVVFSAIVVEIEGNQATATECRDASTETIVDAATGQQVSTGAPSNAITASLSNGSAGWHLVDYDAIEGGC